jgi:hypothetical protein
MEGYSGIVDILQKKELSSYIIAMSTISRRKA